MAQTTGADVLTRQVAFHLGLPTVLARRSEFGCIASIRLLSRLKHREDVDHELEDTKTRDGAIYQGVGK